MAATENKPNVEVVDGAEELAYRCLEFFVADAKNAVKTKAVFYTAVSGGKTPKRFFELLGEVPSAKKLQWDKIQLFWVDERYVPLDSQLSNYKLAADTFLNKTAIPKENMHRIPTEYEDFEVAARSYEKTLRDTFGLKEGQVPKFDCVVLGMGQDGHIGSLFPGSSAVFNRHNLVCAVADEKRKRITLTPAVLLEALHIIVLVSGAEKAGILKEVFKEKPNTSRYPAHILWPVLGKVTWLVDKEAGKGL